MFLYTKNVLNTPKSVFDTQKSVLNTQKFSNLLNYRQVEINAVELNYNLRIQNKYFLTK